MAWRKVLTCDVCGKYVDNDDLHTRAVAICNECGKMPARELVKLLDEKQLLHSLDDSQRNYKTSSGSRIPLPVGIPGSLKSY